MGKKLQFAADFFGWALAINGAVLVLHLFLLFSLGLYSMEWGRAFMFFTDRIKSSETGLALSIILGLFFAIRWSRRPPANVEAWRYWLTTVMRYSMAYVFLDYGFAKIFKGQFTTSLSTLDQPLGEISGFELAWRFFGYSYAYAIFLASAEIVGGALLFFRRTTLLASAILLPVIINIVVVNFTHGIGVQAEAILLLLMTLYLFLPDIDRMKALFWDHAAVPPRPLSRSWSAPALGWLRYGAIAFIAIFTLGENVALYLQYERTTTPLHGVWNVDAYRVNGAPRAADAWKKLYIDTDRYLAIRTAAAKLHECESSVRLEARSTPFRLTEVESNALFLDGAYEVRGANRMLIHAKQGKDAIEVALTKLP